VPGKQRGFRAARLTGHLPHARRGRGSYSVASSVEWRASCRESTVGTLFMGKRTAAWRRDPPIHLGRPFPQGEEGTALLCDYADRARPISPGQQRVNGGKEKQGRGEHNSRVQRSCRYWMYGMRAWAGSTLSSGAAAAELQTFCAPTL